MLLVLDWSILGEERSGLGLLAERSALRVHGVHWLNRVAERSLLRESEAAQSELAHLLVGAPLTSVLLSESPVLDLQELANTASHSLLCAAEAEEHKKWDYQEEECSLEDVASLVVFTPLSRTLSTPVATHSPLSSVMSPSSLVASTLALVRWLGWARLGFSGWTSTSD